MTLCFAVAVVFAAILPATALAQVGDGADALPAIVRLPVPRPGEGNVGFAASAGYGWTESVLHQGDSYSRTSGSLAASFQPTSYLGAALRFDGRYDLDTGSQSASGAVGDPRLEVRVNTALGRSLRLGGQFGLWAPGGNAPSFVATALTPDLSLLASYEQPDSRWLFALRAGFRWDNSAKTVPNAGSLALPDRVELGLNQASAVLFGVGGAFHVTPRWELLADATWDLLVGSGAPSSLESPILVELGGRVTLDPDGKLALQASLIASPSERPLISPSSPLVDIEPRLSASLALLVRPFAHRAQRPSAPIVLVARPTSPPPLIVPPVRGKVIGHALAADGHSPIAHARVAVSVNGGGPPKEVETDEAGAFSVDDLDLGEGTVTVSADGFTSLTRPLTVSSSASPIDLPIVKALPPSEVRGVVRDFAGRPLAASIRLEPVGRDVQVSRDGSFHADVEPGTYVVVVHAAGYLDQTRKIVVERNGVTLLNVELRRK